MLINIFLHVQSSTLSVQLDDLFKRAWEEDITELPIEGMPNSTHSPS